MNQNIKQKILLVEDTQELREAIRIRLTQAGYDVISASTESKALELFKSESPQLLMLDILLEEGNGINILKKVRKEHSSNVPTIILTNLDEDTKIFEASGLTASYYLIKSNITLEEIIEKVEELLV